MIKDIELNKLEQLLGYLFGNDSIFFYNPFSKICLIGSKEDLGFEEYRSEKREFYAIPFFNDRRSSEWDSMKFGRVCFPNYYEFRVITCDLKIKRSHTNLLKDNDIDYDDWKTLFNVIKNEINKGVVKKVVASRCVKFAFDSKIEIKDILKRLLLKNSESFVFAYHSGDKTFLGATPEILVEKQGNSIMSYALAGTEPKDGIHDNELGKQLLQDSKNIFEHKIVVDEILKTIQKVTEDVHIGNLELIELKNLYHLRTRISAKDSSISLIDWVKRLHPTPAMGGKPKDKAIELIAKYEKHDRGLFASPIGIVDEKGDGIFVVGIRSALIEENKLYAYAGCGIVEQSDCRKEYEEINTKLHTILEAL